MGNFLVNFLGLLDDHYIIRNIYKRDIYKHMKDFIRQRLLEGLNEGIIKVPEEVMTKADNLYRALYNDWDLMLKKTDGTTYDNPYMDSRLRGYFKLKDLKGNDLIVDVGLYNDVNDAGAGRMNTVDDILLINLPFITNQSEFENLIEHELIHAMDPLVRDEKVFGKYYLKKGAEPSGSRINLSKKVGSKSEFDSNMDKYFKSQHEFNAFLGPIVTELKKTGVDGNAIVKIFNEIKKSSNIEDVYHKTPNDIRVMFTKSKDNDEINQAYWDFLNYEFLYDFVKAVATKPTLYKKLINKVYVELNK